MNWQPIKRYQLKNENGDRVIFEEDENGRMMRSDHLTGKGGFVGKKLARKLYREYLKNGYKKV